MLRYTRPTQSDEPPGRHVLVYDRDCAFCLWSANFIRGRSRIEITLVPSVEVDRRLVLNSLDDDQFQWSAHYITPDGREYHGGECITRSVRLMRGGFLVRPLDFWGISLFRELSYAIIAKNRPFLSRVTRRLSRSSCGPICTPGPPNDFN
ncbi:MAG: DCC1-like thiol-disulfide oxidoreductase family protein [Chloroflexi bacterium]|nr:DCC1-like thiol-disulfide oxidoreductase family protein [Chloroflexota bacterium]MDA1226650.1 DCC1-like thiol-disulfide oxidoreductase family protein [Chloroflexota bacterium]